MSVLSPGLIHEVVCLRRVTGRDRGDPDPKAAPAARPGSDMFATNAEPELRATGRADYGAPAGRDAGCHGHLGPIQGVLIKGAFSTSRVPGGRRPDGDGNRVGGGRAPVPPPRPA